MKNLLLLFGSLLLFASCSERRILKSAEEYLLSHLGSPESYKRIEWKITDTTFLNDRLNPLFQHIKDTLGVLQKIRTIQLKHLIRVRNYLSPEFDGTIGSTSDWRYKNGSFNFEYYHWYDGSDISLAIRDSINLKLLIDRTIFKIDSLEKVIAEESPVDIISLLIRCRMKLANAPPLTYTCRMKYNYNTKTTEVIDIKYDGVER